MKFFLFFLFYFPSIVFANCSFTWNLSSKNISVGTIEDKIIINNDNIVIKSEFNPSKLAKFLGSPTLIQRESIFKNLKLISKNETIHTKSGINKYDFFINNNTINIVSKENDIESNVLKTVSLPLSEATSFPYLALLHIIEPIDYHYTSSILSKKEISEAEIKTSKNKIEFFQDKKTGIVLLDDKNFPVSFSFYEGNHLINSNLEHKFCD